MPSTCMSLHERAELATTVERTKRNLPFEDQVMLSAAEIEKKYILHMRAALVEAEANHQSQHLFCKTRVPVYREEHGGVESCRVPAMFQLVPTYVQPKTSVATVLKEKARKLLKWNKSKVILRPTAFHATNDLAQTVHISTSYDTLSGGVASIASEWDFGPTAKDYRVDGISLPVRTLCYLASFLNPGFRDTLSSASSLSLDSSLSSNESVESLPSPDTPTDPAPVLSSKDIITYDDDYEMWMRTNGLDLSKRHREAYDSKSLHPFWVPGRQSRHRSSIIGL
ncbi:hypothetical protein FIBSPDRAFT_888017 [Athelia psychrophila]|uniref:Uncharacterized protein n=1 Tax=Athelia psychrophila TaxID=1759441 RepID=A0A166NY47_9AGAM|nr:hypothetical protein FIBSPDRAFT_888017 [Fibularhizoctonia sp. CBS 109695]